MKTLVFFVEGPSEIELFRALETRLLPPEVEMEIKRFRGKQDLEANLVRRMRGWRRIPPFSSCVAKIREHAGPSRKNSRRSAERAAKANGWSASPAGKWRVFSWATSRQWSEAWA